VDDCKFRLGTDSFRMALGDGPDPSCCGPGSAEPSTGGNDHSTVVALRSVLATVAAFLHRHDPRAKVEGPIMLSTMLLMLLKGNGVQLWHSNTKPSRPRHALPSAHAMAIRATCAHRMPSTEPFQPCTTQEHPLGAVSDTRRGG